MRGRTRSWPAAKIHPPDASRAGGLKHALFGLRIRGRLRHRHAGYFFVAPALFLLVLVIAYPAFVSLRLSVKPSGEEAGLTLVHYAELVQSSLFHQVLRNTGVFVAFSVLLHVAVGLATALALNRPLAGRTALRVILLLPWVVPDVVAGIIWKWILNPLYGVANDILLQSGLSGSPVEWLTAPNLVLPSVIAANVWRGFPFVMIIFLAGLQSISQELYESAAIDGAGTVQRFRYVTVPGLRKVIVVAVALDIIWETRRFGLVQAMTGGGPGVLSEVLSTQIFKQYFQFFRFEYASALAIAMTALLLVISLPYVRMILKQE